MDSGKDQHHIPQRAAAMGDDLADKAETDIETMPSQMMSNGKSGLIPQPSDSPDDPLNWSSRKKNTILFIITFLSFLPDYGSSMGAVTLIPQSMQWHLPEAIVQHNLVGNLFCLAAGGIFVVILSDYFGRLPVLFWFQLIAFGTGIWCATAKSFNSYLAARIINGFFATVAQAGGLMWINDMFFVEQHARKINIWSGSLVIAPYLGPFTSAFVISHLSWRWAFWIYTILNAVGLILIVAFADETFFDRHVRPENRKPWRSRLLRLIGIEQHGRHQLLTAISRPVVSLTKLPVVLTMIYYFLNFAWVIGVNVTISTWLTEFYHFKPVNLGLFYFSGITGSIAGEVISHLLIDLIGRTYTKRHGSRIEPEVLLYLSYPGSVLMGVGLIVLGFALQHRWHYMIVAVFAAVQVCGVMLLTTSVNAYLLEAYPEGSGEMAAWVNFARATGGFMASYIEIPWVLGSGPAKVLGIQAGITWAAILFPLFLQTVGKKIRLRQGVMRYPHGS